MGRTCPADAMRNKIHTQKSPQNSLRRCSSFLEMFTVSCGKDIINGSIYGSIIYLPCIPKDYSNFRKDADKRFQVIVR